MRPLLIVLIDGLPHWKLTPERTPFLSSQLRTGPLIPGLGFSVNLYPELLAGLQADDIGFFNKWSLRSPDVAVNPSPLVWAVGCALDVSRFSFAFSRGLHKLVEKSGRTGPIGNVPFRFLPFFKQNPKYDIFGNADYPSIFDHGEWEILVGSKVKRRFGHRDQIIFDQARAAIRTGKNVFAALTDTDAVSHARGLLDEFDLIGALKGVNVSVDTHLARVDKWCAGLHEDFRRQHGERGITVFFSDHGMQQVDPEGAVNLRLEQKFGRPSRTRYLYMYESVMLRLWVWDPILRGEMVDFLASRRDGVILSDEDRERWGITKPEFGHIIYMLNEGKIFFPNFFGGRFPKAMHGYQPMAASQHGIVTCNEDLGALPTHNVDLYDFMLRATAE